MENEIIKEYFMNSPYRYVAKMINHSGYMGEREISGRTCNVRVRIDEGCNLLIMEIMPGIHCTSECRAAFLEFSSGINSTLKCGNIGLEKNNNICVYIKQYIKESYYFSMEILEFMERVLIGILDRHIDTMENIACGGD